MAATVTAERPRFRSLPFAPWGFIGLLMLPIAGIALANWWVARDAVLFGDVRWYTEGLTHLISPGPLYDQSLLAPHDLDAGPFWDQAPSLAPITLLLLPQFGDLIFGGLMVASVVVGLMVIWPPVGAGGTVLLALALVAWEPVTAAIVWGNVNALVFLMLALALRYPRIAGMAIGVAAAAKLTPILGVAWLAGKRDWRGVGVAVLILAVATLGVVLVKGPTTLSDFVVLRMNQGPGGGSGLTPELAIDLVVLLSLGSLAYLRVSFSLAVLAMLVAIPVLYFHYLVWLVVPLLAIWMPWVISKLNSDAPLGWLWWGPLRRLQPDRGDS